jgi:hypothetical protein
MLSDDEIKLALHASRVVPLSVGNPHGPLGLEHLAAAVAQVSGSPLSGLPPHRVRRSLELSAEAWAKLDQLAATTAKRASRPVSASEVAAAILEQTLATTSAP